MIIDVCGGGAMGEKDAEELAKSISGEGRGRTGRRVGGRRDGNGEGETGRGEWGQEDGEGGNG